MSDGLQMRGKALEEQFFKNKEAEEIQNYREQLRREKVIKELAELTNMSGADAISSLADVGVDADTFAAVKLIPLIVVAWSDNQLEDMERAAILGAAEVNGIEKESSAHQLLEEWLQQRPGPELVAAWKAFVREYTKNLDAAARLELEQSTVDAAVEIARSAGGFLGMFSVSGMENDCIQELRSAFM